jgi:RNA polymerase sigma factor (sigma-70 family)
VEPAEFEATVEAAQAGAEWAWSRLYRDLAGPVLGYLKGHGAVEPEDLLGEVFLQVARNIVSFQGDARSFRSWVFTIAHHRLIDERRYRARRPVAPSDVEQSNGAGGDVEQEALAALGTERTKALLDRLTADQRTVLLLRILGDLTVAEVAHTLGKRPGAIKALQRRGLRRLRELIETEGVPL